MSRFHPTPLSISLAISLALLAACSQHKEAAPPSVAPALTVAPVTPETRALPQTLAANGSIYAWQDMTVGAEVGGLRVTGVTVNVGSSVKKGQVLATLASDAVKTDVAQQEAVVAEAKATLAQAKANATRNASLSAAQAVSPQDLLAAQTAEATAQAKLQAALASLTNQKLRLRQTAIVAPDAGVITARTISVGQVVAAGADAFHLMRQNKVEWRAEYTAGALLQIKPGMQATLKLGDGSTVQGTVRQVAPTLDSTTRTGLVYVDLPPGTIAKPGMFVSGNVSIGNSPAVLVPGSAVVLRDGAAFILTVEANKVKSSKVTVGRKVGDRIEIVSQLPRGTKSAVIAQGAGFLKEGDLVKVVTAKDTQ